MVYRIMVTLAEINSLGLDQFVRVIGPAFEHSPWIAEAAWRRRPFSSLETLHAALCEIVREAGEEKQLALIRAHPDLASRAELTAASASEQASARLHQLGADESARFQTFNLAYREKFGFPFVICARLNDKDAILAGFQSRLGHSRELEIETALEEISKIAYLRLQDTLAKPV